jgi:hypothetical protein
MNNGRVGFFEHKGRRILYMDFSGLKPNELKEVVDEAAVFLKKEAPGTLLTLSNFENTLFNAEAINLFKTFSADTNIYVKAGATIGIKGLLKIAYDTVTRFTKMNNKLFNSREEALAWLENCN